MEQADLRNYESRCIQEEAPQCTAACPLHVDARKLCDLAAKGKWEQAWMLLAKTFPLPGILARICDAPCKSACLRGERGGSIEMGALERVCADKAGRPPKSLPYPSKGKTVHVYGGGISGLSVASDLLKKGYTVRLVSEAPGKVLRDFSETVLPEAVIDTEIERLQKLGLKLEVRAFNRDEILQSVEDGDAVFLDSDEGSAEAFGFGIPDDLSLGTATLGIFAGLGAASPVYLAAEGRRAAMSIERFIQGVSLTAGREKEGPYETRLFTSLENVETVSPVPGAETGYSEEQAQEEAARCIQCECMECVKNCVYLEHYGAYPKVYARQIYNNDSIVMGTRQANGLINSCMLCGLCETLCPGDFSMESLCLEARRSLVSKGNMPQSAHEFALRDMAFANGEKCRLVRHAPNLETSKRVFFPGCQLTASSPNAVEQTYAFLREQEPETGIALACCGAPAEWAGKPSLFTETVAQLVSDWELLGKPEIITACPTCTDMLRTAMPKAVVTTLWQIFDEQGAPNSVVEGGELVLHDPCGSRSDAPLLAHVRSLLGKEGVAVREPSLSGELTECCGFGGLVAEANPSLAEKAAKNRAEREPGDYITYCAMCRDMLARTGKRITHILDRYFPAVEEPAERPVPGYSERRENRARLKEALLTSLWKEPYDQSEPYEDISVLMTPEVAERMNERRILVSDIQKVLHHARKTGRTFTSTENGSLLAAYRPVSVTYWVNYEMEGEAFRVHNAWCHRMKIIGGMA